MDDKIFTPTTIPDQPFPQEGEVVGTVTEGSGPVASPSTIPERSFPTKRVAVELLSSALNTKSRKIMGEFQFTKTGALRINDNTSGEHGEILISPDGIVGKNRTGVTTFSIDGDTGDAAFAGTIQTGAVIAGQVNVGNNSVIIDGEAHRIVIYDDSGNPIIVLGEI